MSHALRVVVPFVVLTALTASLTACSGSSSSRPDAGPTKVLHFEAATPSPTTPAKPLRPPPVGACYRLGYDEALAPAIDKKTVPCTGVHTAVTFYVGRLGASLSADGARAKRLESTVCAHRFATFVGGTLDERRLSMLRAVWFGPSTDQASRGAHWFQCDAIALRGDQNLALLRGPLHGVLTQAVGRDHYGVCGTAEPGTAGFEQRMCAAPHSWEALRTVAFAPGGYPGEDQVRSAGQPCKDAAHQVSSDPLHFQWSYQWPSLQQWKAGQTYGVCWAPS